MILRMSNLFVRTRSGGDPVQITRFPDPAPQLAGVTKRLAMARNFYRDASFMVMDEPTSAIDALAEHRIFTRLFADRSSTIIAISHRLATIEKADIVYMLEDGRIVEQGTHRELVALRGRYFRMFESQLTVPTSPLASQAQPGNPAGVGPEAGGI